MTGAIIAIGLRLVRLVFRADLKSIMQGIEPDGQFDVGVRLLQNIWQSIAAAVAYVGFWVIAFIPWQVLGRVFRTSNPNLSRAFDDVGRTVIAFLTAGFCLYLLKVAVAEALAVREINRANARVSAAVKQQRLPPAVSPGGWMRVALFVTTPTDFDLLVLAAIAVWTLIALVNYAHSQHYPL